MTKAKPFISEIKYITCSVSNLERSVKFYSDVFGYVPSTAVTIGKPFAKAWRIPEGLKGKSVAMGVTGINSGQLRLVQWDKPGEKIWGSYLPREILGYYAINIAVKDIQVYWPQVLAAGATEKAPPKFWKVDENLSAWDSMAYDPDGILLDVFQVVNKEKPAKPRTEETAKASEVQTMALHVSDAERYKAFCRGIGYTKLLYETMIENLEQFFGLPKGSKLFNVNLINPECSENARIELAQYFGCPCDKSLKERSVPPNVGILSMSFETDDIEAVSDWVSGLGGEKIGGPVTVTLPKVGKAKIATFFGMDGETIEFYQPV